MVDMHDIYLKYDSHDTDQLASMGQFSDYFSKRNTIKMKPLDARH